MLGKDHMQFERVITRKNVHHQLNKDEIEDAEANIDDEDSIAYMEAPAPKFENAPTRPKL